MKRPNQKKNLFLSLLSGDFSTCNGAARSLIFNKSRILAHTCLLLSLLFSSEACLSEESPDASGYQTKLELLQKSIQKVHEHLKNTKNKKSHVLTELKELESNISDNARALKETEIKINALNSRINQLKKELSILSGKLQKHRETLADQMRAAYALGSQQQIKMMLNQEDTNTSGRVQVYFDYLSRAREHEIALFIDSITLSRQKESELASALSTQKTTLYSRKKQKRDLQKQRQKRSTLLAQIDTKIKNQEATLSSLESSRGKIEDLLMSLGELLADIPTAPRDETPFKQQKGRLPWPIKGPFLAHFGKSKNQGDLNWNGVLIGADYGAPIRSISHGRVAFADWLQGFGFITIVDHGDGFMSLYGHSESLFKQAGDWVSAGDVIASAGDSGGQPSSGLYFEIRSRGKPIDPNFWCSSKVQHATNR